MTPTPPPPVCPHCRERFHDLLKLDQHLRFDCPKLGRTPTTNRSLLSA